MCFDCEQFGARVRALRKEKDVTQAELAELLNVESYYISRIERGCLVCSLEFVVGLSKLFGVSTDYLLTGKETNLTKEQLISVISQLEAIVQE